LTPSMQLHAGIPLVSALQRCLPAVTLLFFGSWRPGFLFFTILCKHCWAELLLLCFKPVFMSTEIDPHGSHTRFGILDFFLTICWCVVLKVHASAMVVTSDIDLSVLGWRCRSQDNRNCFLSLRIISALQRSR
jgi:hypothetical protein